MKLVKLLLIFFMPLWVTANEYVDESVYQIESFWHDQNNQQLEIGTLVGEVQLVAFIYTYCEHTCPTIISKLKQISQKIPEKIKAHTKVTLISLDPERDTPQILKEYMQKHSLDEQYWTMLNGTPDDVLELAALFGVRYKPMGESDIAHSNMITVLDTRGVIRYQMKGLSEGVDDVINEIENSAAAIDA